MIASLAVSGGERVLPAICSNIRCRIQKSDFTAFMQAGIAERGYLAPGGNDSSNRAALDSGCLVSRAAGSIEMRYSLAFRQPGGPPRQFLEASQQATVAVERLLGAWGGRSLRARIEAKRSMNTDVRGERIDETVVSAEAMLDLAGIRLEAMASFDSTQEAGFLCSANFELGRQKTRAALSARVQAREWRDPVLTARLSLRQPVQDGALELELGIDELPMDRSCPDALRFARLRLAKEVSVAVREERSVERLFFP
jgi:hypothetical protein